MDTEERVASDGEGPVSSLRTDRWRALSGHLAKEVERSAAEVRSANAERDRLARDLRALHIRQIEGQLAYWRVERALQVAELELVRARDHIARTQPLLRAMRDVLQLVQDSKFWKARNAWFMLKARAKLNLTGPQPYFVPQLDDTDEQWLKDLHYQRWLLAHELRPSDRQRMRETLEILPLRPRFSVIMPVYNAPESFLREAIESVIDQVYPDWELCIADDASPNASVRAVLEEYASKDARIKVSFRETNGHIAAASNSALELATGDFIVLLDHDDLLSADALYENAIVVNRRPEVDVIYSDEDKVDEVGRRSDPYFKPDWAPDTLLARNYISHLGVYRRDLIQAIGGFRVGFEGSQDYDLVLRATEQTDRIAHIPRVLYHWRIHSQSSAGTRDQKNYALDAATRALTEALERRGEPARVIHDEVRLGLYTVRYEITKPGKVSIIVPTRDHGDDVDRCFRSLFERSTYHDFEIILLDNGSADPESLRVFGKWLALEPERVKLVEHNVPFNFSEINNFAVSRSSGEYLLFLNNDTEIITEDWLEAMIEQAQRPSIGAVGAKLLYADKTVQHAGVIIGLGGVAGHSHKYFPADDPGYFYTLQTVNNFSAVTAACLMVRRDVFEQVGGFDEGLAIAFNDVDLCLRIRDAGYRNIYLPHVNLYHHESKSRGAENTPEKMARFLGEQQVMRERWKTDSLPDPYYNINLVRDTENYEIGT